MSVSTTAPTTINFSEQVFNEPLKPTDLFGGAIKIVLPLRFVDVSELRQVPDNQECFVCGGNTDQSIIVELLEYDHSVSNESACSYHLQELARENGSDTCRMLSGPQEVLDDQIPAFPGLYKSISVAEMQVSKYRETAKNIINVYMLVLRLPRVTTDVLISMNDPVQISPSSSSAKSQTIAVGANTQRSMDMFQKIVKSFRIDDWSLFGCEDAEEPSAAEDETMQYGDQQTVV